MGISGTDKARMFALGGVMRGGASRGGYISGEAFIAIGGIRVGTIRDDPAVKVVMESLTITDVLDETPNTCGMTLIAPTTAWGTGVPPLGTEIIVTMGSVNNPTREFAGVLLSFEHGYDGKPISSQSHVLLHVIDYTYLLRRRLVSGFYRGYSATDIAVDLLVRSSAACTYTHVQANLPVVDEISFTNQDLPGALTQLAQRIGAYWYLDYYKDLHLFVNETIQDPTPLTLDHPTLSEIAVSTDMSQVVTRVYVEGGGVNMLAAVGIGEGILPVEDSAWYDPAGGTVAVATQRLTYTGVRVGGGGTVVGTGAQPTSAPTLALVLGAELGLGVYQYAYTFVTATGETKPSALATITTQPNQSNPVLIGAPIAEAAGTSGLITGTITYQYTFQRMSDGLETAPTPFSLVIDVQHTRINLPLAACEAPPAGFIRRWYRGTGVVAPRKITSYGPVSGTNLTAGVYYWAVTLVTALGETTLGGTLAVQIASTCAMKFNDVPTGPSGTTARKIYRAPKGDAFQQPDPTNAITAFWDGSGGNNILTDGASYQYCYVIYSPTGHTLASPPSNAVVVGRNSFGNTYNLSLNIPNCSAWNGAMTGGFVQIYRSVNGGPFHVVGQASIYGGGNVLDPGYNLTDAAAAGNAGPPTTNTTTSLPDPAGFKLVGTLADNTTVVYTDTSPDAGLGVLAPTQNTAAVPNTGKLLPASSIQWLEVAGNLVDTVDTSALTTSPPGSTQFTNSGQRVALSDIGKGPSGTQVRKIYRTAVGDTQLKYMITVPDNTTTTITDTFPDASLGVNAPTLDTSGLPQPTGQVLAGASSLVVAATAAFSPSGGWAVIGNGQQVIRYNFISGLSLMGIPYSGYGAITASVAFNSSITDAPALTGVPTPAFIGFPIPTGGISVPIKSGEAVNLLVQLDDTVAQSRVAASAGGDGVIEEYLQDGRLGRAEAFSRARASLLQRSAPLVTLTYRCRDRQSRAGRTVSATLTVPAVNGAFKIQQVTIANFGPHVMPTYSVTASSARFSFEDLLRLVKGI